MQLNRSTIITVSVTLGLGIALGMWMKGGNGETPILTGHEGEGHELVQNENGEWTCSMHPQVRQSEPGSCPFCGMDLIPVTSGDNDPTVLKMSNEAIALANIQTSVISRGSLNGVLQLNGKIKADARRVNTQTTHFAGRVERLFKNYEGEHVRKGEKIASIYSPELVAAQEELIEAKKLEKDNPVLLRAARKKLDYWKLSPQQIAAIEASATAMRNFDLLADFDGVVTDRLINAGDHLHEGQGLLEITDMSRLWVVFEVYEQDLEQVALGSKVSFSPRASAQTLEATISFINPRVDSETRIVEVRADIFNPQGQLKPDMFVDGRLSVDTGERLLVPKSAVLWTGKRSVVYLKMADDAGFQLREIELGNAMGEHYEVVSGLQAGDEVVTQGAFTLDAEAQLRGKVSMMNQAERTDNGSYPETGFQEVELPGFVDFKEATDTRFQNQLMDLTLEYVKLKDLMVEGNGSSIRKAAVLVKNSLGQVDMGLTQGNAHEHWMELLSPMEASLEAITTTGNRDTQRLQFINLSKALINAVQSFGTNFESPLYIQFCPMANNDKGATWISREEEIINPYFGDLMLHCGNVEDVIENED